MKKLILGTLMLFSSAIIAQNEYEESSFQGDEEVPMGFVLKESDMIGGAWKVGDSGGKWGFYPDQKLLMSTSEGDFFELKWDIKDNYIRLFNPKENDKFINKVQAVSKGDNTISVISDKGVDFDLERVAEIKKGESKKAVIPAPVVKKTMTKRKVNSPLPIIEKNFIGKWQADNGTIYNFFYNKYVQMTPRNQRMIDCHWWIDNGYIAFEVWGDILMKPQVISVSKTKMTLAVDTGDLHLTKISSPTR